MKFVRLPVQLLNEVISDPGMGDLHILFLSRDPRAIMNSRWNKKKTPWCTSIDCFSAQLLCNDMDSDLSEIYRLRKIYPGKIHFLRYEDVALDPEKMATKILDEFGIEFREEIKAYLKSHTSANNLNKKTIRQSETRVLAWASEMEFENVLKVQHDCAEVMPRFGYLPTASENFTLNDILEPMPGSI